MTETATETHDPRDHRRALGATGLLAAFNVAGVLEAADVHVAERVTALVGDDDPQVALALALAVRAVRGGSVCVDLTTVAADARPSGDDVIEPPTLGWPEPAAWVAALRASPLLAPPEGSPVLRLLDDRLLYLDRYWREEEQVCADLLARPTPSTADDESDAVREQALDRVFPAQGYAEQRDAARIALRQPTTVLTGGPGTGKTTTVAALLALLVERSEQQGRVAPRIALAAPTGKAAARLQQAVELEVAALPAQVDRDRLQGLRAVTLHRLLGARPDTSVRFRHHRDNRLPYDVIVVDETSMVSLTMMARLLEAVRPATRLVLVGDPDQLSSVEAGAVLADLVEGLGARPDHEVAALRTSHRFGPAILALAEAVRAGDADAAVAALRAGGEHVELVEADGGATAPEAAERLRELLLPHARLLRDHAVAGEAEQALGHLDDLRLLCAHREGPFGVRHWNDQVERWLADDTGEPIWSTWYAGRPLLVTANDYGLGIYNGDVGVCVRGPEGLRAHVAATGRPVDLAPGRLGTVETVHAMTIHKSQGSQAGTVVVVLPPPASRLLTRELLYTAITRARDKVVVVGSEDDVRAAVERRAVRATGLRLRLA